MKGEIFNPGQPVKKESIDTLQDSHDSAIRERQLDFVTAGIVADSQVNSESVPFEIVPDGGLTVAVGTGRAVGSHDVDFPEVIVGSDSSKTGAERIVIPTADTPDIAGNLYARDLNGGPGTGTGTGPYKESANGMGGWVSTPQPTKTRHIPLTNGSLNRIWISYLRTIDTATTALHKVNTSQILYTKKMDGYDIRVTTSGSLPDGDQKWRFLGTVDLTSSPGVVTTPMISMSGRTYSLIRPKRTSVRLDPSLSPASYDATPRTMASEDHVNAFGTGVVTPTNPHGLTLADLGFTQDVDLRAHRLIHHSNGLVTPSPLSTTTALYPRTDTSTPVVGDAAMVFMKKMASNESLLMNGNVFDDAKVDPLYKLVSAVGGASAGDYFVSFGTSNSAGVYGIVAKQSGTLVQVEKRISPFSFSSSTEYLVCLVEWSGTAFINPAPTGVQTDSRLFGTVSNKDIQVNSVATSNIQDLAVTGAKLASDSVSTVKIVDLNVTTNKVADYAVTTLKIADANVTAGKIADSAVTSIKLPAADGTTGQTITTGSGVKAGHIQDDAITSQKLAEWDGGSTASQTNTGSGVATGHLKDYAVTIAKLDAAVAALISGGASPVGSITAFGGATPPAGWLECDGSAKSRTTYAALFAALDSGVRWGVGDGSTTFDLPDFRGRFPRGWDHGAAVDPDRASRTALHTGGSTGDNVGSYQDQSTGPHSHSLSHGHSGYDGSGAARFAYESFTDNGYDVSDPTKESRPKNAYVMFIIKY